MTLWLTIVSYFWEMFLWARSFSSRSLLLKETRLGQLKSVTSKVIRSDSELVSKLSEPIKSIFWGLLCDPLSIGKKSTLDWWLHRVNHIELTTSCTMYIASPRRPLNKKAEHYCEYSENILLDKAFALGAPPDCRFASILCRVFTEYYSLQ